MINWINEIFNQLREFVTVVGEYLTNLVGQIDSVEFDSNLVVTRSCGTIKYLVGPLLYNALLLGTYISGGLLVWKISRKFIEMFSSFIPGIKGKIKMM